MIPGELYGGIILFHRRTAAKCINCTTTCCLDELFLALVRSTKGHAELLEVDTSAALALPGVVGYVDHSDVPGSNITGIGEDELIFAKDEVYDDVII